MNVFSPGYVMSSNLVTVINPLSVLLENGRVTLYCPCKEICLHLTQ